MRPAATKAAGKEKSSRRKGGGGGGGAGEDLLTDRVLSLRARLHDALSLGLTRSDGHGAKKWQSTDAGIQSHALKAVAPFLSCLSNDMLRLPPIKESISDILVLLEGALQTKNVSVLIQVADVMLKLVSSIGNSIRQYPIMEIVRPLSCQLTADQLLTDISCARAMNCILNSLVTARSSTHADIWQALDRTNAVASIVSALQSYTLDVHPLNYLTELISLLTIILWIWPSSRYHVWSNCNLMGKLAHYCLATETTVAAKVLRLYAALALCGHGAMILLKNEVLMAKICELVGTSHPGSTRIEALKLCQVLLRSSKGCNLLMTSNCQPIVEGIIDAMSRSDDKTLVTEGCRTALLVLRYAGNHHQYFWSNAIDKVLYNILTGCCISSTRIHQTLSHEELFNMVSKNFMDIHPYVWDILGYLVVHCNDKHFTARKGQGHMHALISCACLLATDVMHKSSPVKFSKDVQEPALRAVLMMLLSPNGYILSEASFKLSEVVPCLGDGYLSILLSSLESNTMRSVTTSFDSFKIMTNLMNLACLVLSQPYHNLLNRRNPVDILSTIIKECLHNHIHVTRSKVTSHLHFCFDGSSCCCCLSEEWEGENIVLFYGLVVLFNLLKSTTLVCVHCKRKLDVGILCHTCKDEYTEGFLRVLQCALCQSLSSGQKLYIAHILSLFGLYGSPSKLGGKMRSALDDNNELADLEIVLSDGQSLHAHRAIISVRCPKLLPSVKSLLGSDGEVTDERSKPAYRVQMSDRVDSRALKKILEYTYAGFVMVDDDNVKPVRTLAKYCHLKPLQDMLQKEQPRWNSDYPRYDLAVALGAAERSFSDIILEAQSNEEVKCSHGSCELSTPHVHGHKIVLSMSCDYLRALFHSGMHESFSDVIRVPVGWRALEKLVHWFYSGELPGITPDCRWKNLGSEEQLSHLNSYAELSSLSEFWFVEGVKEESLEAVASCLGSSTAADAAVEFVAFAAGLGQWEMVEAGVRSVAHLYPRLRDSGQLERLDDELLNLLRTEYVRFSQHGGGR